MLANRANELGRLHVQHLYVTLTFNAVQLYEMRNMTDRTHSDIPHTIAKKPNFELSRPLSDVKEQLESTLRQLRHMFRVPKVVLILPPHASFPWRSCEHIVHSTNISESAPRG